MFRALGPGAASATRKLRGKKAGTRMRRFAVYAMGVLTCVLLNQGTAIAGPYLIGGQNYT